MSEQFKVGDICIGHGFVLHAHRNGMECQIIDCLGLGVWRAKVSGSMSRGVNYRVRWSDGEEACALQVNLRRKQPPKRSREMDTKVSWSDCAWKPYHVRLELAIERAKEQA